jgi:plastocyanin
VPLWSPHRCRLSLALATTVAAALTIGLPSVGAEVAQSPPATGRVSGTVRLAGANSRRLATPGAYPDRRVSAVSSREASELQNVVIYARLASPVAAPATQVAVRQTDEEFVPHVVVVTRGSTVEFPNDDFVFHNVFSLSRAATFDLGRYPKGATKSVTFARAGIVKVYCHLHSHMSAVVRVFDHPYFTTAEPSGRFTLDGLPTGRVEIAAWHERIGETVSTVTVGAGETSTLSFSLPIEVK